jgi:hypothetical protein
MESNLSAPPRKNWWQRNWIWFVPTGCFGLIALAVVFFAGVVLLIFGALKSSDVYQTAVSRAKSDQRVTAALGTPIREGMFPSGSTSSSGGSGDADLVISISGPKGKGKIYAVASKSGGQWNYSKLSVEIEGGETIDLNEQPTSP